jgi:uncharacterized membrane protein HdeD (DUF308 family)
VTHVPTTTAPAGAPATPALRRLHLVRAAFAAVWAVLLVVAVSSTPAIGPVTAALLVIYPLVDVGAAVEDARRSRGSRSVAGLSVTAAISALAAVGLAVAAGSGVPAVLQVWGVWAVVAGLAQLSVALRRRGLGGRWAMIASGGLSVLAGTWFFLQAGAAGASLGALAGYALLGGVFFLVSALRLRRT